MPRRCSAAIATTSSATAWSSSSTSGPAASPRTAAGRTAFSRRSKPRKASRVRPEGRILGLDSDAAFIRQYASLAGMTATAESAAEEFQAFFGLKTVVFPPNRECRRVDEADVVFTHRGGEDRRARRRESRASTRRGGRSSSARRSVRESEELGARAARPRRRPARC